MDVAMKTEEVEPGSQPPSPPEGHYAPSSPDDTVALSATKSERMKDKDGKPFPIDTTADVMAEYNAWQRETPDADDIRAQPTIPFPGTSPPNAVAKSESANDTSFEKMFSGTSSPSNSLRHPSSFYQAINYWHNPNHPAMWEPLPYDPSVSFPSMRGTQPNHGNFMRQIDQLDGASQNIASRHSVIIASSPIVDSSYPSNRNSSTKVSTRSSSSSSVAHASASSLKPKANTRHSKSPSPPTPSLDQATLYPPSLQASATTASLKATATSGLDSWQVKFQQLIEYKKIHGNTDVPQKQSLGSWVNKQRMEKKKFDNGDKTSLTLNRQHQLESIGFRWAEPKGQAAWEKRFNELVAFQARTGHCNFPTKDRKNPALGRWLTSQRADKKSGRINPDNERRLSALGFCWDRYGRSEQQEEEVCLEQQPDEQSTRKRRHKKQSSNYYDEEV